MPGLAAAASESIAFISFAKAGLMSVFSDAGSGKSPERTRSEQVAGSEHPANGCAAHSSS